MSGVRETNGLLGLSHGRQKEGQERKEEKLPGAHHYEVPVKGGGEGDLMGRGGEINNKKTNHAEEAFCGFP